MTTYHIEDFVKVFGDGFDYQLPQEARQMIESIANEVGAPDYICTPSFEKKHIEFKSPVVKEVSLADEIRKNINKISDRTFDTLSERIIKDIKNADDDNMNAINIGLFEIASGNAFYSSLYAKLYKRLSDELETFLPPSCPAEEIFKTAFSTCDPNKDYDRFCDINKENERRRALALFFVNLMKEEIVGREEIIKLIQTCQSRIQVSADKFITDELSEILFIVVSQSKPTLSGHKEWSTIVEDVTAITKMKQTADNGLTTKAIFKHMDLLDAI